MPAPARTCTTRSEMARGSTGPLQELLVSLLPLSASLLPRSRTSVRYSGTPRILGITTSYVSAPPGSTVMCALSATDFQALSCSSSSLAAASFEALSGSWSEDGRAMMMELASAPSWRRLGDRLRPLDGFLVSGLPELHESGFWNRAPSGSMAAFLWRATASRDAPSWNSKPSIGTASPFFGDLSVASWEASPSSCMGSSRVTRSR
mmetsp:Transcript_4508/g.12734  ORF Transcript_4508/g.12734 Transcript_4508/m.12734 type:complete len:206 (+) Transcript_4508:1435-2052(+)